MSFKDFFSPFQQEVITKISLLAPDRLFAVGGIVRDYLLKKDRNPIDVDLVIEGDCVTVAETLHRFYPQAKLQTYPKFLTAELLFPEFTLDIATARQEVYPQPGSNPQVSPCCLLDDLARRDFTVNALALPIAPGFVVDDGKIIDRFEGLQDLERHLVRTIRSGSFIEDPRRIFRAVRFAVKLNFNLADDTLQEIRETIVSNIHRNLGGSRFRSELLYIFHPHFFPDRSVIMLQKLAELEALSCIHQDLQLPHNLSILGKRLKRWHSYFLPDYNLPQLALELLASNLPLEEATKAGLIRGESIKYLTQLPKLLSVLSAMENPSPSQIFNNLQAYELPTIVLGGVLSPDRQIIWEYLNQWRNFTPMISGHDLQEWGCPRGKTIGIFLKQLRSLELDGQLGDYQTAQELVKTWLQN